MRRFLLIMTPLALIACGSPDADQADVPETGDAAGVPTERIEVTGFSTPESVLHDTGADVYLVSNINGEPLAKDGNGFISRVTPDGEVEALRWIDGEAEGVELNAPKGMAILGDTLYVADIDCVRRFVRTTGAPEGSICFEGATFLNDIAVDDTNVLHVTDTGMQAGEEGLEPSGSQAIHQFAPDGRTETLVQSEELGHPNGIAFGPRGGFVVTFGSGEIYVLDAGGQRTPVLPGSADRQLDGIVFTDDGGFVFTSWGDRAVHHVDANGAVTRLAEDIDAPADLGYDATRDRVMVPLFMDNTVIFVDLPHNAGEAEEAMD